jgi:hypothetical protein
VHLLHEVFHGPDILDGITLSIIRDLREVPDLRRTYHPTVPPAAATAAATNTAAALEAH